MQLNLQTRGDTRETGFRSVVTSKSLSAWTDSLFWMAIWLSAVRFDGAEPGALLAAVSAMIYLIPFAVFSLWGAMLTDKLGASRAHRLAKASDIPLTVIGAMVLAASVGDGQWVWTAELVVLALLGTRAAVLSTARYSLLPEILDDSELAKGNGILEQGGFWGTLLGCITAVPMVEGVAAGYSWVTLLLPAVSIASLWSNRLGAAGPAARPAERLLSGLDPYRLLTNGRLLVSQPRLLATVLGISVFWGISTLFILNALHYGIADLELAGSSFSVGLLAAVSIGMGAGSWLAGRLSIGTIELGLVPLGSAGWVLASLLLFFAPGYWMTVGLLVVAGACAGWFLVPMNAFLQKCSPADQRADCIATANIASVLAMLVACLVQVFLGSLLGVSGASIFLLAGLVLAMLTYAVIRLIPDFFVRTVVFLMTRTIYRIRVVGLENIPRSGPGLIVLNHTSFADGNLLVSIIPRMIRFVVYRGHYDQPFLRWLGEVFQAIAVDSEAPPKEIVRALRAASEHLKQGELLCVFAEGSITRTGFLLPFQRGFELIVKHAPEVPIIPGYIDGMWGSIFSFERGKFFWKWPRRLPYPVTIRFGAPMPADASHIEVREQVQLMGVDCFELRAQRRLPLHRQFVRKAKRYARRPCIADSTTPMMTYGQVLMRSVIFRRLLARHIGPESAVGVYVPPTAATALANVALSFLHKVPINLNYTTGKDVLDECIRQAGIRTVLTSKKLIEKVQFEPDANLIYLEDLRSEVRLSDKLVGLVARFAPAWFTEYVLLGLGDHQSDELATIIFSSGSTGIPKGVMLTHHNVGANIEQTQQMIDANEEDRVLGILPIFHSFGYTATLWLPLMIGASIVYHVSPLDAEIVGRLCKKYQLTIGVSTATFLRNYLRKCHEEDFRSLRLMVCGAEKLPQKLADEFGEKFGIRPMEGYGCTECSPVVSANRPDVIVGNYHQVGNKPGTIGHPVPGMCVRIVDPDTGEPLPLGQAGMLLVKGPNVMRGYLNNPELTASVLKDGWYETGDVAKLDEDGFLTITDRLSRFSKIAGEMVPHGLVEENLQEAYGSSERVFAVTGVPDQKKGERLIVVHTPLEMPLAELWEKLRAAGLPPLWLPARNAFHEVPELPILGTGKVDLRQVKQLAKQFAAGASPVS